MKDGMTAGSTTDRWGDRAEDYEAMFVPFSTSVAAAGLHEIGRHGVDLGPGVRFLDVAAGTGALTLQVEATGATVTAIDSSEGMLELLRRKLPSESRVEASVMDGTELEFDDRHFHLAGSSLGIALFSNPKRGLEEMRRVLCDGGYALVTAVANPLESPLMQTILRALDTAGNGGMPVPASPPAPLGSSAGLFEAMADAGYRDVDVVTATVSWEIGDALEFWRRWGTTAPPVAALFNDLPADLLAAAGVEFERMVNDSSPLDTAVFETDILIGTGCR